MKHNKCKNLCRFCFFSYLCKRYVVNKLKTYFYNMTKQKIIIERELRSNSESIIWELISTAEGLARWVADDVQLDGKVLKFTWGQVWSHHEIREAVITDKKKNQFIRYRWIDETDEDAYIELKIIRTDLTNDYILCITDYALPEDAEQLSELWEDDLDRLHRSTGM